MKNWKTTTLGVLVILSAIINAAIAYLKAGTLPDIVTICTAVSGGWALVWAKDPENPSGTSSGVPPVAVLALCGALRFSGCATDANGAKKYVGPSFGLSVGYQGIDLGFQRRSLAVRQLFRWSLEPLA